MHRARHRAALVLALVSVIAVLLPDAAQADRQHARDTRVIANGTRYPLATVRVDARQGDEFSISARMRTKRARQARHHRMLVELSVECAGRTHIRSTQNIDYGSDVLVHRGRFLFTAPGNGSFSCTLMARGMIHGEPSDPPAHYVVDGAGTYISASHAMPVWVKHTYQDDQHLVRTQQAEDLLPMSFTAPAGVQRFTAVADLELTNCYNAGQLCDTSPSMHQATVAKTRLVVMQKARGWGYCRITRHPAHGLKRTSITWVEHHKKVYHHLDDIPVSTAPDCTRDFRIKVYTRAESGNDLLVEADPYTNLFVQP